MANFDGYVGLGWGFLENRITSHDDVVVCQGGGLKRGPERAKIG